MKMLRKNKPLSCHQILSGGAALLDVHPNILSVLKH